MEPKYAVVLIKPDAIRDILEAMILQELQNKAFVEPIFHKYWKIDKETAQLIYPEWINRPEFPSMVYNIMQGLSLFVVVKGYTDIFESLKLAKGKMNKGGIRLKYRTHSIEEWKALGYSGRGLQNKVAENRIHATDDFESTVHLCALALHPSEMSLLEIQAPCLATAIRSRTAIQKWTAPK